MARRKTTPIQLVADDRHIRALQLRKAGVSLREIVGELGYASESGAHNAIMTALAKARQEPADELRELMAARLDEMLVVAWDNALQGDTESMMAVLKIEDRRARLYGIDRRDAPVKANLSKLARPADGMKIVGELLAKATNGELSPDDAAKLSALVQSFMKIAETAELAERVSKLEEMRNAPPGARVEPLLKGNKYEFARQNRTA